MVALAVDWQVQLEAATVWQRQAVVLQVEAVGDEPFARLRSDTFKPAGMEAIPLTFERSQQGDKTRLSQRWLLFPYTPGTQTIRLPEIKYTGGRRVYRWQPPEQVLQVKPLSPYLPPTLPVGPIHIESRVEPDGLLLPGELAYWHIHLESDQVPDTHFPPLLKQVQGNTELEVLPAKLERQLATTTQTANFSLAYRIPFKPQGSGRLELPTLQWHWFDPASGRLEQVQYVPPRPWVISWVWRGVPGLLLAAILLAGAFFAGKTARRYWRQWRAKQRVLRALQGKADPQTVRQAMQECAAAHGWPENFSTGQWLQQWERVYGTGDALRPILESREAVIWHKNC